ncbi:MAG: class I SAM-dependent methyltransferase [Candidatus Brocadiia bacterium]|nr:MAG: class I SAM-dependent methyltransferase [Candidatus Brocadiia bacterium]
MNLPSCLICGRELKPALTHLFDDRYNSPGTYDILRCCQCGLMQTWPQPNASEIEEIYKRYYNCDCEKAEAYTIIRRRFISSLWYRPWLKLDGDICFHLRQGKGRLLDVGCNEGRGLGFYSQNGFQSEGLEINVKAAAVARARGFTVHTMPLGQFNPSGFFDVIVLSNVLEHALDPIEMLKHVHRLLQPNGQVWISCPNADSLWRYRLGRYWIHWHLPFHLWHFSPRSLEAMLTLAQFQIMKMQTFNPAIWIAQGLSLAMGRRLKLSNSVYRSAAVISALTIALRLLLLFIRKKSSSLSGDCLTITARPSAKNIKAATSHIDN